MKQLKALIRLELCNLYGFNVFRNTKDKDEKKRYIALSVCILVLFVILMGYISGNCYGYIKLGVSEIVPAYLVVLTSMISVVFSALKSGGMIFRKKGYEMITAMPVPTWKLIISRFLRLYVENLIIAMLIMVPGLVTYAFLAFPGGIGCLLGFLLIFFVPCIPTAVSIGIGVLITGIASRMKNKALAEALLSIVFVVGVLVMMPQFATEMEEMSPEAIAKILTMAVGVLENWYPPAAWFATVVKTGSMISFMLFILVSLLVLILILCITKVNFHNIFIKLNETHSNKAYKMGELKAQGVMKTLITREARRYFSSGVYVSNTIMGPILGMVFCISLLFIELDSLVADLPVAISVEPLVPLLIGAIFSLMPPVACSISMEGKQWWILKTMPLTMKSILDAKLLFNLLFIAPFYVVAECFVMIALKPTGLAILWLILIPALMIVFSCVFGLFVNLKYPKFEWETEVYVVKQSLSSMLGGLGGLLVTVIFMVGMVVLPEAFLDVFCLIGCSLLGIAIGLLYRKNMQEDLKVIG